MIGSAVPVRGALRLVTRCTIATDSWTVVGWFDRCGGGGGLRALSNPWCVVCGAHGGKRLG